MFDLTLSLDEMHRIVAALNLYEADMNRLGNLEAAKKAGQVQKRIEKQVGMQ